MPFTAENRRFFDQFGYIVMRQLFSPEETAAITLGFERTLREVAGYEAGQRPWRTCVLGPIQHRPEMSQLLDHPGIVEMASAVLGPDFNYVCGDGNLYSGDTQWHPDGGWGDLFACKIAIYLDPLTRATGALRVIPGSHLRSHPLRTGAIDMGKLHEYGIDGASFPGAEALESNPGDVVFFNHDTYHAAFGGRHGRRMFTMNLTKRCKTPEDIARLKQYISIHSPAGHKVDIGSMHFHPFVQTASPSRMVHLEQPIALYPEVFPGQVAPMSYAQQVSNMRREFVARHTVASKPSEAVAAR